jgi:hypothetical protein
VAPHIVARALTWLAFAVHVALRVLCLLRSRRCCCSHPLLCSPSAFAVSPHLQRAQDITNNHTYLTEAQQKLQQPFKQELWPILQHVQQRELERKTYK